MTQAGRKVAIIGGGPAALSAAYELIRKSDRPEQITLFVTGWRIGGKCASGRTSDGANHEHGLHVLGGFYSKTLRQLRQVFRHWQQMGEHPTMTLDDALLPVDEFGLKGASHRNLIIKFPRKNVEIDDDPETLTPSELASYLIRFVLDQIRMSVDFLPFSRLAPIKALRKRLSELGKAKALRDAILGLAPHFLKDGETIDPRVSRRLAQALALALKPVRDAFQLLLYTPFVDQDGKDKATLAALAAVILIGLLDDDLLIEQGFDKINTEELSDWLKRHGARSAVVNSPFVAAGYDYPFAYKDGITDPPQRFIAAGVAVRGYLNLILTYNGSFFRHLNGGTGDILFIPYLDVLRRQKGVSFAFFHRIDHLKLSADGLSVEEISGMRLATAKTVDGDADPFGYDPLTSWNGQRVWPQEPKFDQLLEGEALAAYLKTHGLDLESDWLPDQPPCAEPFAISLDGKDQYGFTDVIVAIPPLSLKKISGEISDRHEPWRISMDAARQIPTISVELRGTDPWKSADYKPAMLTGLAQPLGTWADLSFIVEKEGAVQKTAHLALLCGAWPVSAPQSGEAGTAYLARVQTDAEAKVELWCNRYLSQTMRLALGRPSTQLPTITSRRVKVNLNAADGYVLSPPGSIDKRLFAGQTMMKNLFLAGDWTNSQLDAGSVESAVNSGIDCAHSLIPPRQPR